MSPFHNHRDQPILMCTNHLPEKISQGLSTITVDLVLLVCTFLKGRDIIALRQTCKYLAEVTRERTLWLDAAQRACRENVIYQPSFDLRNMTIQEMEYTSMGLRRFERLAQSAWANSEATNSSGSLWEELPRPPTYTVLPATRASRISLPVNLYPPYDSNLRGLELVPGGRFLITLEEAGWLEIYDLSGLRNTAGDDRLDLSPCVSMDMGKAVRHFTSHASPDPNVLKLFFEFYDQDSSSIGPAAYIAQIVDVDLSCDPPIVKKYDMVPVPIPSIHAVIFKSVVKDDLVFTVGYHITLGSLRTNMFAKWKLPAYTSQVMMTETEVLVISCHTIFEPTKQAASVLIYNRPALTIESADLFGYEPQELAPDIILPLPADIPTYRLTRVINDGYTGSLQSIWFDLIHSTSPTIFTRVRLLKDTKGQYTLDVFPTSAPKNGPEYSDFPKQRVHEGDGKLSSWWVPSGRSQIHCSLEDVFPGPDGRVPENFPTGVLYEWDDYEVEDEMGYPPQTQGTFCGVSGRLVYVPLSDPPTDETEVVERRELLVIDYL